mgnify:CR=1 FL=1
MYVGRIDLLVQITLSLDCEFADAIHCVSTCSKHLTINYIDKYLSSSNALLIIFSCANYKIETIC